MTTDNGNKGELKCCRCGGELSLSEEEVEFSIEMGWDKTIICSQCARVECSISTEDLKKLIDKKP